MAEPPAPHIAQQGSKPFSNNNSNSNNNNTIITTSNPSVVSESNSNIMNDIPMNNSSMNDTNNDIYMNRSNGIISSKDMGVNDVNMEGDSSIVNTNTITSNSSTITSGIMLPNNDIVVDTFSSNTTNSIPRPPIPPPPYVWDNSPECQPSQEVLQLWTDVGNGIDKSQTGMFVFVSVCENFHVKEDITMRKNLFLWICLTFSLLLRI
jgi:hypothetical protein